MQLVSKRFPGPGISGLLATRRGALALALACAVCAAAVLVFALGQYRHGTPVVVRQATVLVANQLIPKGTSADVVAARLEYTTAPVLASQVSAGALSDAGALRGKVATRAILPGEQLKAADFAGGGGITGVLGPAQRAVAVSLDPAHGLSGELAAGDHVDVYASFTDNGSPIVTLLVADAVVLHVPAVAAGGTGSATVLSVFGNQAPALAYAAENGKVWLFLRPAGAQTPSGGVMTLGAILLGSRSTLTPNGPKR